MMKSTTTCKRAGCLFGQRSKGQKHISASNSTPATGGKAPGWYGKKLTYRLTAVLAFVALQCVLFACAANAPTVTPKADVEVWQLELKGQTVGTLKMKLKRNRIDQNSYQITGRMSGIINDHVGGRGEANYKVKGKIEKDVFKAKINGHSNMSAGPSSISGHLEGTVAKSLGSGSWRVFHAAGISAGKYNMKKITPSQ